MMFTWWIVFFCAVDDGLYAKYWLVLPGNTLFTFNLMHGQCVANMMDVPIRQYWNAVS